MKVRAIKHRAQEKHGYPITVQGMTATHDPFTGETYGPRRRMPMRITVWSHREWRGRERPSFMR